jgi:hypothetical protein
MNDHSAGGVGPALAVARLRAWRMALLDLHKLLIDEERRRYERAHGPIGGPRQALRLLMQDPWFGWLRPMGDLIVRLDERLAGEAPVTAGELEAAAASTLGLLHDGETSSFGQAYRRALQDVPDVVVAHGRLLQLLNGAGRGDGETRRPPKKPASSSKKGEARSEQ